MGKNNNVLNPEFEKGATIVSQNGELFLIKDKVYNVKYTVYISDKFKNDYRKVYKRLLNGNMDKIFSKFYDYFNFSYFHNVYGTHEFVKIDDYTLYKVYPPFILGKNSNVKNSGERILLAIKDETLILLRYYSKEKIAYKNEGDFIRRYVKDIRNELKEMFQEV